MDQRMLQGIVAAVILLLPPSAYAEEGYKLTLQDHQFKPAELSITAGQKVKVFVENKDSSPEEFESYELNREKIVPAGGKITVFLGPLKPGRYKFFGEFHKDTAQGTVVVTG
jgi:plastocyanin